MKKVILNQKSYMLYDEVVKYKSSFDKMRHKKYDIILFPNILYLTMFKDSECLLGTQNFFSYKKGSFTGELNLESLRSIGVTYTMVGQYERKKIINESNNDTREKLFKSLNSKFHTLLFCGEKRKTNNAFIYIKKELNYYLKNLDKSSFKYLSLVYEPSWALGTGEIQDVNKISKIVKRIKIYVKNRYDSNIDIYYGGIINKENIQSIFDVCDGIVLGKVSTDISEYKELVKGLK